MNQTTRVSVLPLDSVEQLRRKRRTLGCFKSNRLLLGLYARQALQQSGATVPSKDRVVVVLWANFLCLFEAGHCVLQQGHQHTQRSSGAQLRLGPSFVEETGVVEPLERTL